MNTLIKITEPIIDQETVQAVNARELYTFLEVNSNFRDWIKNRIKEYGFLENKDFMSFTKNLVKPNTSQEKQDLVSFGKNLPKSKSGRPSTEYYITLDMAKELSMVERNEKGRQARRYFIECEKKLRSQSVDYDNDTRFSFPKDWEKMSPTKKAVYIYGPLHMHLVKAFTLAEESKHYKTLIKEAKQVLARSMTKAA
ncbi:antA/AntB antirepressor family protein [Bartonella harrusi]|uniref:AntA/AntB antirepressor family protein n=1 Tax=Bartonella harrusi TaxID=2961895 RepID=A0ABY5EV94_9HYPH|nr:antA/AntB antirepressor family protein [Bartonella harrusi]UTO29339.1 antA/AntB antirepressor family protein [Bartonella harrusi]UTO29406.1 antA/AntB antirepressor family protein [Bartonella harrusi]